MERRIDLGYTIHVHSTHVVSESKSVHFGPRVDSDGSSLSVEDLCSSPQTICFMFKKTFGTERERGEGDEEDF